MRCIISASLIQCLFEAEYYEEALQQCKAAIKITEGKPLFFFLYSAVLFAAGKSKEALVQLEQGLKHAPQQVKKFVEFNPSILQNSQVVDLIARYRKAKRRR
jgi:predicted Zn-dependent protease